MYCTNCGAKVENGSSFCTNCGKCLKNGNENKKKYIIGGIAGGVILFFIVVLAVFFNSSGYYFSNSSYSDNVKNNNQMNGYKTVIVYDNQYYGVDISNDNDARKLIIEDSVKQKNICSEEIKQIENEFISKFNITAVNLCEMDLGFARELESVFEKIYSVFPNTKGYITNLTLRNVSSAAEIAAFMPAFPFATSNSNDSYPWVFKTQVLLSSNYFLNKDKLKYAVEDGSNTGHFPPNATIYSPIAHELGHYISFLALIKHYSYDYVLMWNSDNINDFSTIMTDWKNGIFSLQMLNEAYENYKTDTNTSLSFDEFRRTISGYALSKDENGEYIYDETIAEAFHDVYLNDSNACDASKYIVNVLNKYLNK